MCQPGLSLRDPGPIRGVAHAVIATARTRRTVKGVQSGVANKLLVTGHIMRDLPKYPVKKATYTTVTLLLVTGGNTRCRIVQR